MLVNRGDHVKAGQVLAELESGDLAAAASESLVGRQIGAAEIGEAAELVQGAIDPGGSIHASKEFQRHLARVLTTRALTTANQRARRDH